MGEHVDEVGKITCPVSFHYGDSDHVVPMDEVNAIQNAFAGRANADIRVYPGGWATTFRCRASRATTQRWRRSRARVLSCFKGHVRRVNRHR